MKRVALILSLTAFLMMGVGCTSVLEHAGVALFYWKATLPAAQIHRNIAYRPDSALPKHKLDLFLPKGTNWPVLIFIHGGGWTKGDKGMIASGADVYQNIGRFYANHGIGVAVINYRLQPDVDWRTQLDDVVTATVWVHSHIADYGGDPRRFFVSGHSAGAQLAARVALDENLLKQHGLAQSDISGAIALSGAALDLSDEKTYELGASRAKYEARFGSSEMEKKNASPITYVTSHSPPFLIFYGSHEKPALMRQAQRLREALSENNISNQLIVVPRQNHEQMVLCLSRNDKTVGPAIIKFIESKN